MESTETGLVANSELDPNLVAMMEGNTKLKEWFVKYPEEKDTASLPIEQKKEFILTYYSEDINTDDMLEKMLDEAEKILDTEIEKGHTKAPFTPELVFSTITIAKAKIIDELVDEVDKYYKERRKLIKGKEINDPGVIKVTQLNCSKMAMSLQHKILKQTEEEAKSRNFPLDEFMESCVMASAGDVQSFVEIERLYNFRKAEETKEKAFNRDDIKKYVEESLSITKMIESGNIDGSLVIIYPHLLSDKLFNITGYESEEVVNQIRKAVNEDKIDDELANLIIQEAYAVERCRESCQTTLDNKMLDYESAMANAYEQRMKEMQNIKDPLDDPAIKKFIEMGMMSKNDAEQLIKMGQMMNSGMPPGMMPPGMSPGMMPGMMPPPEMLMQMMHPGMFDPRMFPPESALKDKKDESK